MLVLRDQWLNLILLIKGCYISNTSKCKILTFLTEYRSMISIAREQMAQMLTRSFNRSRVQIMKKFKKQSREYKILKSHWKLYLMKYDKLNKTTPYYLRLAL